MGFPIRFFLYICTAAGILFSVENQIFTTQVQQMEAFITDTVSRFGYGGIVLMIMAENIFPPIPSELILTFGGFLTTVTDMKVWAVTAAATAGSLWGAVLLYMAGSLFDAETMSAFLSGKWGRMLHLYSDDICRAQQWFAQKGCKAVFLCRFVPVVRSLISIPAGMAKMNFAKFILYTGAGSLLWNAVLINAGTAVGYRRDVILQFVDTFSDTAVIALVLAAVFFAANQMRKRL